MNDTLGEATGDAVLVEMARRLVANLRCGDTVCRLGGDDFAVILEGAGADQAMSVANELSRVLASPIALRGRERVVTSTVGIACSRMSSRAAAPDGRAGQPGRGRAERLLRDADIAMSVAFQPIFDLDTFQVTAAEALVRWSHPRRGPISPERFVPVAEQAGLIRSIGRLVLTEACRQASAWRANPAGELPPVHVNLSGAELMDKSLIDEVAGVLDLSGLDPRRLVIELTESVLVKGAGPATTRLSELKSLGVRLAIDDFGTGYSSLSYLEHLPVDEIKLDRSFVQDIHLSGAKRRGLAAVVVQLGELFGMKVIAEGIEREEELAVLYDLGCRYAQGFLLGRPVTPGMIASRIGATRIRAGPRPGFHPGRSAADPARAGPEPLRVVRSDTQ
ncbi:MAG: putative bifunctional diguanylate cyclase/phosphodiesterase [Acidimicrobiales bacterium]